MTLNQNFNFMASINNLSIPAIVVVLSACSRDCSSSFWQLLESSASEVLRAGRNPGPQPPRQYPQKFKSLVLTETSKADELKRILNSNEYEVLMESTQNKEDKKTKETYMSSTAYYTRNSTNANEKELIIVQQEENRRLSLMYMQGDLSIDDIQWYLNRIRVKLRSIETRSSSLTSDLGNTFNFEWSNAQVFAPLSDLGELKEKVKSMSRIELKNLEALEGLKELEDFKGLRFEFPEEWDANTDSIINLDLNTNNTELN